MKLPPFNTIRCSPVEFNGNSAFRLSDITLFAENEAVPYYWNLFNDSIFGPFVGSELQSTLASFV